MRFNAFLNEKHLMDVSFKYDNKTPPFPVYMNPSTSDYIDLKKSESKMPKHVNIRFIVDLDKKNVFAYNASMAMHEEVLDKLKSNSVSLSNNLMFGIGPLVGNKIEIHNIYQESWEVSQLYDYKWAKLYFINPKDLINKTLSD